MPAPTHTMTRRRLRLQVTGAVQGVGFRPFLYRAARDEGLAGWIRNDTRGVMLEVEGDEAALTRFSRRVADEPPPRAVVQETRTEWLPELGLEGLVILPSEAVGDRVAAVLPDLATCDACLEDVGVMGGDASDDRRYRYAFTNCTDCGPRFSIIRALPYDRPNTTMAGFELCPACRAEYDDPMDRRFHAQPTACPDCGPRLWLVGAPDAGVDPIAGAVDALRDGRVLAVKGLGGFHLVVDAANDGAVRALRARKHRPDKPFAVMVRDLGQARALCRVPPEAEALLVQPEAPIVLLERQATGDPSLPVAPSVAPGNPYLGLMLPYTPLHHLLVRAFGRPIVATSGNRTDEPICTDGEEALERLDGIADVFVLHDRPIQRPVDDSVVAVAAGAPRFLRRSRGYAPLPVRLDAPVPPILAVGGHLKNTIALSRDRNVFLSQHIGDLETPQAMEAFEAVIRDFLRLYDVRPGIIAHDLHPDYVSSTWAAAATRGLLEGAVLRPVQHHHAHLAACLAEHGEDRALGVVWDGTGLGTDGTIWGGEFLLGGAAGYDRVAHLRPFRLPGGDAAVKEPRRVALALAHAAWGEAGVERALARVGDVYEPGELAILRQVLDTGLRAPWTTSMGRLFDGVAGLLGLYHRVSFEGQAAMALEYAADPAETGSYRFELVADGSASMVVDWVPALDELLDELSGGTPAPTVAARFHNGLVDAAVAVARTVGEPKVALTGGVFQNRILLERGGDALRAAGFEPLLHRRVPANDGGLCLGQVLVAAAHTGEA